MTHVAACILHVLNSEIVNVLHDYSLLRLLSASTPGVHMIFNGQPVEEWVEGEARKSILVFIGRKLDRKKLLRCFADCHEPDGSE